MRNDDGSSQSAAKIVLAFGGLRIAIVIIEEVGSVQSVVAEIIEQRSVPGVCTGASGERKLAAWRAAVLRGIGRGKGAEFLQIVKRNHALRCADDGHARHGS